MKELKRFLKQQIYFCNKYKCNICVKKTGKMIKEGIDYPIFEEKEIIGAGIRVNGRCPRCFSIDRYRFFYYY